MPVRSPLNYPVVARLDRAIQYAAAFVLIVDD
jgi:hypothetical protein